MGFLDRFSGSKSAPSSGVSPAKSEAAFTSFVAAAGATVQGLDAETTRALVLDFYRSVPAKGCLPASDGGDMLLYEWGVYDWGSGEWFEFSILRQFSTADDEGDDSISQLHVTLYHAPTKSLRTLGAGERWCSSVAELSDFETFITDSAAYQAVARQTPHHVEVWWEHV